MVGKLKVTVFIKTDTVCVQCNAVKRKLASLSVPFESLSVDTDPAANARVRELGYSSAPVTLIEHEDGSIEHWYGYDPERMKKLPSEMGLV